MNSSQKTFTFYKKITMPEEVQSCPHNLLKRSCVVPNKFFWVCVQCRSWFDVLTKDKSVRVFYPDSKVPDMDEEERSLS